MLNQNDANDFEAQSSPKEPLVKFMTDAPDLDHQRLPQNAHAATGREKIRAMCSWISAKHLPVTVSGLVVAVKPGISRLQSSPLRRQRYSILESHDQRCTGEPSISMEEG